MSVKLRFFRNAWWIFIDHHGKRRAKRVGDQETARRVAKELREQLARTDLHLPILRSEAVTFERYTKAWLKTARLNLKASTVRFYEGHLDQHIVPALGSRAISEVRRGDCRDLVIACRTKGLKVSTVRGIARTLSTILTQAVEDELLPANPALRLGRYLRTADEAEPVIDPLTRDEVADLLSVARSRFPDWYPWVLCGLRTGMRAGELLALQWGDVNWRESVLVVQRNLVRAQLTTPKNHQRRRVDMSRQLRAELRLWRRRQHVAWLKHGRPFPEWVFSSVTGSALDESNVRKAFNRLLKAAGMHCRGPHQMRHTFASLLLQEGAPITYVSRQLGHRDASITLRVYAHWVPDHSTARAVNLLDDAQLSATQPQPAPESAEWQNVLSPYGRMVSRVGIEPTTRRLRVCCSAN
jgi:integrase